MSKMGEFSKALDKLYQERTHWLRAVLGEKKPGRPPVFNRKKVGKGISKLQRIASSALSEELAKNELAEYTEPKRAWHVKGFGREQKRQKFDKWYNATLRPDQECVYIFWNRKQCLYVGRTGVGGSRPRSHFEKFWFAQTTRVDVYPVKQLSNLPKLECLGVHRFHPARNKNKPSIPKWAKKCPVCRVERNIKDELRDIFRFR
jgi:hypothetical protein